MTVLFSPIGTADPLTQLGDGPMLHIVRHKRPSKVVLFLSPSMALYQKKDHRYTKSIELLSESMEFPMPEIELIESDFDEVYRFDHYIEEFETALDRLDCGEEPVLVNASSGTAGMSQALVALGSFGRLNLELLQVITPKKGINARHDREDPDEFDLEELWGWNEETNGGAECRIVSVRTPNFSDRLLRENIIGLVKDFEYEAAYRLACQCVSISREVLDLIRASADRLNLDGQLPAKVFGGTALCYRANDLLGEYPYAMEVKLLQGHWADFVRAMSPALTEIMRATIGRYVSDHCYLQIENGKPTDRYNLDAIYLDSRLNRVLEPCHHGRGGYITNDAYMRLIEEYCVDEDRAGRIRSLRNVEYKARNSLAHQLRVSSKRSLEKDCEMSMEKVMELFFELHGSAEPGLYRRINDVIVSAL